MPYTVVHRLTDIRSKTRIHVEDDLTWARFSARGPIDVSFIGRLERYAYASYFVRVDGDGPPSGDSQLKTLRLTMTIRTPDGEPFPAEEVALADLRRFRDLRGVPQGTWSYSVVGESMHIPTDGGLRLVPSNAHVIVKQHELVPSSSAPPLVDATVSAHQGAALSLDLFHVGRLEVVASPGVPVTAASHGEDRISVFLANPAGGVYTASGSPVVGWGPWATVSDGSTVPGGTVTPCELGDGRVALFVADPGGGVYCCVGSPVFGFGPWRTVAEGTTLPGAPVAAVHLGEGRVRVLRSDAAGGVYSVLGKAPQDWGGWGLVSEGVTTPGGPIATVYAGGRVRAFIADPMGGVYTASVGSDHVWSAWQSVADGSTIPGGQVSAAVSESGRIRVVLADAGGAVYIASRRNEPNWGIWSPVPGVTTLPGAPIGIVAADNDQVRLVLADRSGAVRTTVGSGGAGWAPWEHISEGATMPGAPVATVRHASGRTSLTLADRLLGPYAATSPRGKPWSTWSNVSEGSVGGRPRGLRLLDPDGTEVATGHGFLSLDADLPLLKRSRDPSGTPRPWSLEVAAPATPGGPVPVQAQVVATTRLPLGPVNERIDALLGPDGGKVSLSGNTTNGRARLRMTVTDRVTAATLDFHGILDPLLDDVEQDDGVGTDLREGVAYTLVDESADVGYGIELDLNELRVTELRIDLGAADHLLGAPLALKVTLGVAGDMYARIAGFPLATASLRADTLEVELGLHLGPDGEFATEAWVSGDGNLVDVDVHWAAAIAAGVVSAVGLLTAAIVLEIVEANINAFVQHTVGRFSVGGLARARHVFAKFLGADFTYLSCHVEGSDLVLGHLAAIEPQPTPSPLYRPVNGRTATQDANERWEVEPDNRGDTWANANLLAKIDHVVVVMMENRSYDHVLGHLALASTTSGDGLDAELVEHLRNLDTPATHLAHSAITPNGVGLRTKFPCGVGHSLDDVAEQLSERTTLPSGREVAAPTGFISNFAKRLADPDLPDEVRAQVTPGDVMGYYTGDDLAFFRHLTEHYAYSDQFYCSHPGPTLPNRMLSLVGDVQYTRSGEAVLDNNHGEEFYLSRAMSIYDLLTRHGVDWRVYESFPSVTMLRMFGRYTAEAQKIVRFEQFLDDVRDGDLPSFTVVDPAMHHKPQTDDHPVADMYRGQDFLDQVYRTLRANERVWERTLLLITYDEHGGFYDHVVPPVAEILDDGTSAVVTPYGVRVPTFAVSPWVQAGLGPPVVLDHCSILKTVLARFCGDSRPFLSDRVHAASSFEAFLTEPSPRLDVPPPPTLPPLPDDEAIRRIITEPVFRREMRAGNVDYHDLTGMLARDLGRDLGP